MRASLPPSPPPSNHIFGLPGLPQEAHPTMVRPTRCLYRDRVNFYEGLFISGGVHLLKRSLTAAQQQMTPPGFLAELIVPDINRTQKNVPLKKQNREPA